MVYNKYRGKLRMKKYKDYYMGWGIFIILLMLQIIMI